MRDCKLCLIFLLGMLFLSTQAAALTISPGSESDVLVKEYGDQTDTGNVSKPDSILGILAGDYDLSTLLYKVEDESGVLVEDEESALLWNSYFVNGTQTESATNQAGEDTTEFTGMTISYVGAPADFADDPVYLLVKDGSASPAWYFFDLTDSWNGIDDLVLLGFWAGTGTQGSISHVSLYGGMTPVPEPATTLLFGLGLVGFAGVYRKRILKGLQRRIS